MGPQIKAWRPNVPGIHEVLHARFTTHAYPSHTHDAWTLLLVDDGMVRYDLDRHEHGALRSQVTLLPPGVPHDGRSPRPFRKRVLYLAADTLTGVGAAVDHPSLDDPLLRQRINQLHESLDTDDSEDFEAQSRFALIRDRLRQHLRVAEPPPPATVSVARRLRDLLDAGLPETPSLDGAAALLEVHPVSLVRAFSREFGIPPHRYVTGRRLELARRHLLAGHPAAEAATMAGFYDQAHLTRHFRKLLGIGPSRYGQRPLPA
jgi:AraC-like DNA-binding protein